MAGLAAGLSASAMLAVNRYRLCLVAVALLTAGLSFTRAQNGEHAGMPWEAARAASQARFIGQPPGAQRIEPFKLFENVSYVGIETVASYLVPTKEGLILIDATYAETADLVLENVRRLGHDPAQIKYVLVTHAHPDHVGGAGRIKEATGARVGMSAAEWERLASLQGGGGAGSQSSGIRLARDLVLGDGEKLTLGEVELWFYVIGGHTPGNAAMEVHGIVNGREFRTVLGAEFTPASGATAASLKTIERLRELGPWDAMLPSHPYLAPPDIPLTARQLLAGEPLPPHPTKQPAAVGAQRVNAYLDQIGTALRDKLARERSVPARR